MSVKRKLPILEPETAFFWTAGATGQLQIQRCGDCGHWQHPPTVCCLSCQSETIAPQPVSGRGRVATFTINYEAWYAGMEVPFIFAAIELEEQAELYIFSNVIAPIEHIHSGLAVSVFFEQHDDIFLPLFRPLESAP